MNNLELKRTAAIRTGDRNMSLLSVSTGMDAADRDNAHRVAGVISQAMLIVWVGLIRLPKHYIRFYSGYLPSLQGNAACIAMITRLGAYRPNLFGWSRRYIIVMFIISLLAGSGGKQNRV